MLGGREREEEVQKSSFKWEQKEDERSRFVAIRLA
jgi:hypothetical protein